MGNIKYLADKLLQTNEAATLDGKLDIFGNVNVQNISTSVAFIANVNEEKLITSSSKVMNSLEKISSKVASMENNVNNIVLKSKPGNLYQNILVQGDILIHEVKSNDFRATSLNGRLFEPQYLLTLSGNETLSDVWVDTLIVHNLSIPSLAGKRVDGMYI